MVSRLCYIPQSFTSLICVIEFPCHINAKNWFVPVHTEVSKKKVRKKDKNPCTHTIELGLIPINQTTISTVLQLQTPCYS